VFKQLPTVSRVFVKTSATPRFTITDVGDDVVRLEVENTRASRRNDTRPLDTSFFPSAVALITPSRVGTSYVVDIKLRKRVPYQQKVEGDVLAIDFERPPALGEGGPAGGSETPSAAAPGATLENRQGMIVDPEEKPEGAGPTGDQEPAAEQAPKQ
jgi:colicin import membrane protein